MVDIPIKHFVIKTDDKRVVKSEITFYLQSEVSDDKEVEGVKKAHCHKMVEMMRKCSLKEDNG